MDFLNYFGNVFTVYHMALLIGGTFAGLVLGALPGLSPTMAVALMIPFTFHMEPAAGLILLGAMYTATVAGGAISAILVNVPGAPANIATAMDGHQLANQGRAAEALYYCFTSSFIGGVLGIFVLIFFTPPLADLALKFGPTELFWIAILGITIIFVDTGIISTSSGVDVTRIDEAVSARIWPVRPDCPTRRVSGALRRASENVSQIARDRLWVELGRPPME